MENTTENTFDSIHDRSNELTISPEVISYFTIIRKWTKFFAILGFIFMALMVIASFFIGAIFSSMPGMANSPFPMMGGFISILYILIAVLYFFPLLYMLRFSNYMKQAIESNNASYFALSIKNLKAHFNFIGIVTIIFLSLYALILFGLLITVLAIHH